jgi:hypothetical protein
MIRLKQSESSYFSLRRLGRLNALLFASSLFQEVAEIFEPRYHPMAKQ